MEKFYKCLKDKIQCLACNRFCVIEDGEAGYCGVRSNQKGKLKLLTYGKPSAIALDPIEKKPLYHFYPGAKTLSFCTVGCNFSCVFCQNYTISKEFVLKQVEKIPCVTPEELIALAKEHHSNIISATYTEPTVFVEYTLDTAKEAKKAGMKTVWVTNGYFSEHTFKKIRKYIDAMNIDLKGDSVFYKKYCDNVQIELVKKNICNVYKSGIHLEITNLIIPGLNDKKKQIQELCKFVASVSKEIPIHFSAFYPKYKLLSKQSTDKKILEKAKKIAKREGIKQVYLGNV